MADYLSRYPFMDFPSWAGGGTSISDGYMGRILADGKNYILSCPSRALTVAVNASLHSSSGSVGYVRVNEAMAALSAGKLSRQTLDSAYHQAETLIYSTGLMVSEQWVGEVVRAIELRPGKKTIILTEWLLPQLREAIGPAANAKLSSHGFFFVLTRAETLR